MRPAVGSEIFNCHLLAIIGLDVSEVSFGTINGASVVCVESSRTVSFGMIDVSATLTLEATDRSMGSGLSLASIVGARSSDKFTGIFCSGVSGAIDGFSSLIIETTVMLIGSGLTSEVVPVIPSIRIRKKYTAVTARVRTDLLKIFFVLFTKIRLSSFIGFYNHIRNMIQDLTKNICCGHDTTLPVLIRLKKKGVKTSSLPRQFLNYLIQSFLV